MTALLRWRSATALLVLPALVVLGACGDADGTASPAADDPAAATGAWQLVDAEHAGVPLPLMDEHPVTLTIEASTFGGRSACNSYGGEVTDGVLDVRTVGGTEMACEPGVMALEVAYHDALEVTDGRPRVDGDRLVLTGETTTLTFETLPPVPTAELLGTEWVLDSLVHGEADSSTVSSTVGDPATLLLHEDGSIQATTGCRTLTGRWVESGAEVLLPETAMAGECPPGAESEQDDHVVAVLGDGFRPAVEGATLTLTDAGGLGLVYRAP